MTQNHSAARVPMPRFVAYHFIVTRQSYDAAIAEGRRFYTDAGESLEDAVSVKAALKRDGLVVSKW